MPAMKSKLRTDELETIVRLVRSFRDDRFQVPEDEDEKENSSRTEPAVSSVVRPTGNQPSQPVERATPRPVVNPLTTRGGRSFSGYAFRVTARTAQGARRGTTFPRPATSPMPPGKRGGTTRN
jgi:hypothetical protein